MLAGIKQTEHQIDYNECWAFFFFFAVQHIQEALSFCHLSHRQSQTPLYKTPTCLSITTLRRGAGERDRRGRKQVKVREDESRVGGAVF